MNGESLNPREHDFDEEFRKESQFVCVHQHVYTRGGFSKRYAGNSSLRSNSARS